MEGYCMFECWDTFWYFIEETDKPICTADLRTPVYKKNILAHSTQQHTSGEWAQIKYRPKNQCQHHAGKKKELGPLKPHNKL